MKNKTNKKGVIHFFCGANSFERIYSNEKMRKRLIKEFIARVSMQKKVSFFEILPSVNIV